MLSNLTGWHALIILAVVLLVFGAAKLPALARSIGQSVRILQKEVHKEKHDTDAAPVAPAIATESAPARAGDV
jgi:sec-independent protein translocase protein TatA